MKYENPGGAPGLGPRPGPVGGPAAKSTGGDAYVCLGGRLSSVLLVLPQIALCFSREVDLGLLTGWRGHLEIGRFIANPSALGPREAQVNNQ